MQTAHDWKLDYLVVYQNWIAHGSRRFPVVVLQDPTESLPALDRPIGVGVGRQRGEQLVAQPLVVSFSVIMHDVLREKVAEMSLAEGNDAMQALGLHGSHEAFGESV